MLVIRLARTGRKKHATYRLVVADSRHATTSKFVKLVGHYNPHTKELVIDKELVQKYLKDGAQPSNRVAILLKQQKVNLPSWVVIDERQGEPKTKAKERAEAKAAPKEAPAEVPTPAPDETTTDDAPSAESSDAAPEAVTEVAQEEVAAVDENKPEPNVSATATADTEAAQTTEAKAAEEQAGDAAIAEAQAEAAVKPEADAESADEA